MNEQSYEIQHCGKFIRIQMPSWDVGGVYIKFGCHVQKIASPIANYSVFLETS
jgi:hypothetical protein